MKTYMQKKEAITRKWYVVDAAGLTVGRMATQIAMILNGKNKPTFTPHVDCGDNVIVINAEKAVFTKDKLDKKKYYRHSGYAGGLTTITAREMQATHPERIIEFAVKGMLPKGKLGRAMNKKLFVYAGSEHPHQAQQPELIEL
jgi:large subunit ribosomal protein L13